MTNNNHRNCAVCGKSFPKTQLFPLLAIRSSILEEIENVHPGIDRSGYVCRKDLSEFRTRRVQKLLLEERGELSEIEENVIKSMKDHDLMAKDVHQQFEENQSFGQRVADHIASFGGSWTFLFLFAIFLCCWMGINLFILVTKPFDPYPFILLNLILSCVAAVQAPVIMMSQNRQGIRDRAEAKHDYEVNLKAELEIRHLSEKMDHLLVHQWERLMEIQQVQIELINELKSRK